MEVIPQGIGLRSLRQMPGTDDQPSTKPSSYTRRLETRNNLGNGHSDVSGNGFAPILKSAYAGSRG